MYLLVRTCSCYTENCIVLGCFGTEALALSAKARYIEHLGAQGDPHSEQGYMDVCLEEDVYAEPLDYDLAGCSTVYLLYEESEGFGQVLRGLERACASLDEVLEAARAIEIDPNGFPTCLLYTRLEVDALRFENEDVYILDP